MATITNEFFDPGARTAAGWINSGTGGSFTRVTTSGAENNDSIQISGSTADGGARIGKAYTLQPQSSPLGPRSFSFDARLVSGDALWRIAVFEFSSADGVLASNANVATFTVTSGWLRYSGTYTPTNPSTAYVLFGVRRAASVAATIGVDRVMVQTGSPTSYFDGDSPNAVWTGTPHASASTLTIPDRRIFPVLKVGSQQRIGPLRAGKA